MARDASRQKAGSVVARLWHRGRRTLAVAGCGMVDGVIARAAAMAPAPAMQRKAVRRTVIAVRPVGAIRRPLAVLWRLRLAAGDE